MDYVLHIIGVPQWQVKKITFPFRALLWHVHDHFIPHARNNYHPHVLSHRSLGLFSALLVAVKIFSLAVLSFGPVVPAFSSAITTENIIALTNESRKANNLSGLSENSLLNKAAQAKAQDMLLKGYFSHNTPDNKTPWDFIAGSGYSYLMAGENLAVNFTESEQVEQAWMNSPGHKANILNKNFEEIGIGIAQGEFQGHTAIFVVQMFGTPIEQKVTITNTPTKVLTQDVPVPAALSKPIPAVKTPQDQTKPATVPVVAAENQTVPAKELPEALSINNPNVTIEGGMVKVSAIVSEQAVKVVAYFGQKGIMLNPKPGNAWEGLVPLSSLAQSNRTVRLEAFDLAGGSTQLQLADFASSTVGNFNVLGATNSVKAGLLGKIFDPKGMEQRFYLLFVTGILSSMILAIGIKRHVQHLSLITNSSFVAILATLLWVTG